MATTVDQKHGFFPKPLHHALGFIDDGLGRPAVGGKVLHHGNVAIGRSTGWFARAAPSAQAAQRPEMAADTVFVGGFAPKHGFLESFKTRRPARSSRFSFRCGKV